MKSAVSIPTLYVLQLFFIYVISQEEQALPVIIKKGNFRIASPIWKQSKSNQNRFHYKLSFPLPPWNQIYHYCPPPKTTDGSSVSTLALQLTKINKSSKSIFICEDLPSPTVVKVLNIEKFKKHCSPEIEWYVVGFKINSRVITDGLKISSQIFDTGFRYDSVNEGEAIIPGYSVFYNKIIKQVVAAEYKLLPSKMYEKDAVNFSPASYFAVPALDLNKITENFVDSSFAWVYKGKKPNDIESCKLLVQVPLISPPHFIYWFYKRMAWVKINIVPMWHIYKKVHQRINEFLEAVAQRIGKLKITSGVAGIGSTNEEHKQHTYTNFKNNLQIIVSDFLWKFVEFKHMKEIYGIILVQVNTFSEPSYKICEEDVCSKHKWMVQNKEKENTVYCCNATANALNKLEVPFLNLKERKEFDLTPWGFDVDAKAED